MSDKSFVDEIYAKIGESDFNQDVSDWLGVGYLPLNNVISGRWDGGLGVGRITEIFGAASSGKTMMATMAMKETQRRGGIAILFDYEHAFSMSRGKQLGLTDDTKQWIYKQPETAEQGFAWMEQIMEIIRKHDPARYVTCVYDSVAAMMTKEELEAGFEGGNMKTKLSLAAVLSMSLKRLAQLVNKTNATLIFLNQTRTNPGIMFGDKESTTGGNALKFYASTRIKLTKTGKIKEGDAIIGDYVKAQTVKNKIYEPFKEVEFACNFKDGMNIELSHIMALTKMGKLGATKGWLEFEGEKFRASGLEALMKSDPEFNQRVLNLFSDAATVGEVAA